MSTRKVFEQEMLTLREETIKMGTELEKLLQKTIRAIVDDEHELAKAVMAHDDYFDALEVAIEKQCVSLIMHQQPIAKDLRLIMSTLKIVTDMERIADQCEDICAYSIQLDDGEWSKAIDYKRHIERMAMDVAHMLSMTIDSFVQRDTDKLEAICHYDDKIDANFERIWQELIEEMNKSSDFAKEGARYIMIIKYFERIADHITNIAEWLIYNLTGTYANEIE